LVSIEGLIADAELFDRLFADRDELFIGGIGRQINVRISNDRPPEESGERERTGPEADSSVW
jgi:hypothetical protein